MNNATAKAKAPIEWKYVVEFVLVVLVAIFMH
jgi:hypothetical protein